MECPKKKKNVTKNQNFGLFLFQKTDWQIYDDKALWFVNNMKSRNQQVVFNTASSEKGTTLKVANSEFQFFGYYVMGLYE